MPGQRRTSYEVGGRWTEEERSNGVAMRTWDRVRILSCIVVLLAPHRQHLAHR